MAQEYLPAPSNIRLADLMKEHNISQPELAKELGCSKSTINRFISGAKGTLTHEQVLKIARLFNVSTDFLLGETQHPRPQELRHCRTWPVRRSRKEPLHGACQYRGGQPAVGKRPVCRAYLPHSAVF
mgnify:CR=1 FL=1